MEHVHTGQLFDVVVDYAHTPDSLEKVYEYFRGTRKICVLGNAGGGRDRWKRPLMGHIAGTRCAKVYLTNEDPYDEDPQTILLEMEEGIKKIPGDRRSRHEIILDRREAIRAALGYAKPGDVVIITGKGTDPFIMGPRGQKLPWDDKTVVTEELQPLSETQNKVL